MKRWIMLMVILSACAGCLEMTTPAVIETTTKKMDELMVSVDAYQDIAADLFERMEKDKLIASDTKEEVAEINAKVDELQPVLVDGVTAVLETEYSGDKLVDIVKGAQAANKATATVNPYAPAIDAILKMILALTVPTAGVGVSLAVKNKKDANKASAKYKAHDQGKEAMIRELRTLKPEEVTAEKVEAILFNRIGQARAATQF